MNHTLGHPAAPLNRPAFPPAMRAPAAQRAPAAMGAQAWAAASDITVQHAERHLLDALERVLRSAAARTGWVLLVLHLSRIAPAGPRPYHRRVAAAVLDDTAGRSSGQLFGLDNGDVALLFRPADEGAAATALIARLFQADMPDADTLRSLWRLPAAAGPALAYVRSCIQEAEVPALAPEQTENSFGSIDRLTRAAAVDDLLTRQTAVRLRPRHADRIVPLFRTLAVGQDGLAARLAAPGQAVDPMLLAHLAARLDGNTLAAAPRQAGAVPLHLRLSVGSVLSDGFAQFASAWDGHRQAVAVELSFDEIVNDPRLAQSACERLRLAGMRLVLDGVSAAVLRVSRPEALEPHWTKLDWSPATPAEPDLAAAVARLGAERIVVSRCETEAALTWGLSLGIQRFQGPFIETMLAAGRMRDCTLRAGCTMVQCRSRAGSGSTGGQAGCGNPALLDRSRPA